MIKRVAHRVTHRNQRVDEDNNAQANPPSVVLASKSAIRRSMLQSAGVVFESRPADLDEEGLLKAAKLGGQSEAALMLARAKALRIARKHPSAAVIGSDQVLIYKGDILQPVFSRDALIERLTLLCGETHELASAAVVVYLGEEQTCLRSALVRLRPFSQDALQRYLEACGPSLIGSAAGYQIEGHGAQLIEALEGDFFTALGMPLFDVLKMLRSFEILET